MGKQRFDADFDDFYAKCLDELKARPNWTEAFIPQLDRFVTITSKLAKLNAAIVDEEVTIDHTNKAGHTNQASSPAWRMFLMLNREANALARELKLSPDSAPTSQKAGGKKGFETGSKMKVA